MLLSMIPYPKVLSRFRLTSISLRSRFTLASFFFTLLCYSVALLLTDEWTAAKEGTCLPQTILQNKRT